MTGYVELRESAAWLDLSSRGKIRVTGEDRARLLHAMSTGHIQGLAPDKGTYVFFLNDKGRILGDAYIYNLGESLLLDTEPETVQKVYDHLDRYIIADDAILEDETAKWTAIGLEGPQSARVAREFGVPNVSVKHDVAGWESGFVARVAAVTRDGYRLFLPADQKQSFIERLDSLGVAEADAEAERVVRLENGIPRYGEEISERYLVQETQVSEAVHPNKGCYLGQEIVERVRSRGQVHRLLTPIRIKTTIAPEASAKLTRGGKDIGEIVSAAFSPALKEVVGMAYIRAEALTDLSAMMVAGSEPAIEACAAV